MQLGEQLDRVYDSAKKVPPRTHQLMSRLAAAPDAEAKQDASVGKAVGAGIGVFVALLMAALVLVYAVRRRKRISNNGLPSSSYQAF